MKHSGKAMLCFPLGMSNSARLKRGHLLSSPLFSCNLNGLLCFDRIKALKLGVWLMQYDTNIFLTLLELSVAFCYIPCWHPTVMAHYITTCVISSGRLHKSDVWVQCLWEKYKLLTKVAGTDIRCSGGPQTPPKVLGDLIDGRSLLVFL